MNPTQNRRQPRVQVNLPLAQAVTALQARITWPNEEISEVLDISYQGLAAVLPGVFKPKADQPVKILLELGAQAPVEVRARVVWVSLEGLGLQFSELDHGAYLAMRGFLDLKLLGASLKAVEKTLFSPEQTFQYWYQAPGLHVFIWLNAQGLVEKVRVQHGEDDLQLFRGQKLLDPLACERKALLLLSQLDLPTHPMEDFVRSLEFGE